MSGPAQEKAPRAGVSLARHPRATRAIRRAKGHGGLGGFALGVLLSLRAGVPLPDTALRGVEAGAGGYVALWFGAVVVWRQLAVAEVESMRRRVLEMAAGEVERGAREGEA